MLLFGVFTLTLLCICSVHTQSIPDSKCMGCICEHESGCQPIGCRMDEGSLSCGYFQIKSPYYSDCLQYNTRNPSSSYPVSLPWQSCGNDLTCSTNCVYDYMLRYAQTGCDGGAPDCETFARIHNGGPGGCNSGTDAYWAAIKKCYDS